MAQKRALIEPQHRQLSIARQCALIGLPRASYYAQPAAESAYNQRLMRLLDEQFTRTPFYGSPRLTAWLRRQGYAVNRKRVARLMQQLGLHALYPGATRSQRRAVRPAPGRYPYLLAGAVIERSNQVWSSDITYVRLQQGWVYLVAILDWFSRYVITWQVSSSLESDFCVETLERALRGAAEPPQIFNSDQGVQFTSAAFLKPLQQAGIAISQDGRGRCFDNIFVERLWRTVKYEEVYLKEYSSLHEARRNLDHYLAFYNEERLHQALGYQTPAEVYRADSS